MARSPHTSFLLGMGKLTPKQPDVSLNIALIQGDHILKHLLTEGFEASSREGSDRSLSSPPPPGRRASLASAATVAVRGGKQPGARRPSPPLTWYSSSRLYLMDVLLWMALTAS